MHPCFSEIGTDSNTKGTAACFEEYQGSVKITEVHWIFLALRVTKAPEHVEGPKALRNKEPVSRTNATGGQQRPAEYFTSKLQEE